MKPKVGRRGGRLDVLGSTSNSQTGKFESVPPSTIVEIPPFPVDQLHRLEEVGDRHAHPRRAGDAELVRVDFLAALCRVAGEVFGEDQQALLGDVDGDQFQPPVFFAPVALSRFHELAEGRFLEDLLEPALEGLAAGHAAAERQAGDAERFEAQREVGEPAELGVDEKLGHVGGVVPGGQVAGDDRAGAGPGDVDPFRHRLGRVLCKSLERPGQRYPLDAPAAEHPVGLFDPMFRRAHGE